MAARIIARRRRVSRLAAVTPTPTPTLLRAPCYAFVMGADQQKTGDDHGAGGVRALPKRIAVEGPIGVGKSSLVRRLAESLGYEPVLEHVADNPFLDRFYGSRSRYALQTQLFFLFHRIDLLERLRANDPQRAGTVADFMIEKEALFARVNLDAEEYRLHQRVYAALALSLPPPDLVIYLQAPTRVLQQRIKRRGIGYEQHMDADYLEKLADAYTRFFHDYSDAPLLVINATNINIVDHEQDYRELLERILQMRSGRHFFNPLPLDG